MKRLNSLLRLTGLLFLAHLHPTTAFSSLPSSAGDEFSGAYGNRLIAAVDFTYTDTCSGAPTFFFSVVGTADSITWDFGDAASGPANFSILPNPSHTYANPGQFTVILTAWLSGVPETETKTININDTPDPDLGADISACTGNTVNLSPGNFPGAVVQWQDGSLANVYSASNSGQYSVAVTSDGCTGRDTINAIFSNLPVVDLGPDRTACQGTPVILDASFPGASYLWQDGSTSSTFSAFTTGIYTVTVSIGNCSASDQVFLTFNPSPFVNLGADTVICAGFPLFLDATNPNASYLWQNGSNDPFIFADSAGVYSVTVSINTCTAGDTISIDQQDKPKVTLGEDSILCLGMAYRLDAFNYGAEYEWQDGSSASWFDARISGKYFVTATNNCGVSADTIYLTFNNCECLVYLPDAFSPNRDNRNDIFRFTSNCNEFSGTLEVFNRTGKVLFFSDSQDEGWDGTYEGRDAPAGAYVYVLKYKGYDNGRYANIKRKGSFLLIR